MNVQALEERNQAAADRRGAEQERKEGRGCSRSWMKNASRPMPIAARLRRKGCGCSRPYTKRLRLSAAQVLSCKPCRKSQPKRYTGSTTFFAPRTSRAE